MKFATASIHGRTFVGLLLEDGRILDILRAEKKLFELETVPGDLVQCIQLGEKFINHVKQLEQWARKEEETESYLYTLKEVLLLAPIPRPAKNIYCVGKNYRDHALELGTEADIPEHVMLFSKTPTSVIGHEEKIDPHLHLTTELDYEGELAVVIGKKGKQINKEDALDYVFGYTIVNDITARDLQARHKQFLLGKSLDTSCPMGPVIVHQSSFAHLDFEIETKVNGEVRQRGQGKQMIFSIPEIISTISQGTTLEPGDIIATGTPAGVGKGFKPPKYLRTGDVVEITIEPIGTLRNYVGE
ncbi:fumarylacetoacetate hydrolase family protein [Metabacillus arenae]|uniref:Fumarylacetoacetate hydrolase family protein n=1 Tax=Metabacillus arenae TaxID=2771434 RepID=A0A926RWB7_9BACI|nr:fumarylacetoacetate hydrolase family protein [Metabacillus arenae]MBD1380613.1 fumarylacetoacetate hydrolase family protein [Metabacillus arenae]